MGLDITVYTKVVPFDESKILRTHSGEVDYDWTYDNEVHKVFCYDGFEQSLRPLVLDTWVQSVGDSWGFRAGSYSGYSHFRDHLAAVALGVQSHEVWSDPDLYRDKPFFELLNFADNEGTIGGEACKDLLADFEAFEVSAFASFALLPDSDWLLEKYDTWTKAVRDAAPHGMIDFH
jgi:hypothetical protein